MTLISNNIKILRKFYKLRQEDLAEKLNINRVTLSDYERGRTYPSLSAINAMANYFNISMDILISVELSKEVLTNLATNKTIITDNNQVANGDNIKSTK